MNNFLKSIIAVSILSACQISTVSAATYEVIDKGDIENITNTYGQETNLSGEMILSGSNLYDFPMLFQFLDEDDFDDIEFLAKNDDENRRDLLPYLEDRDSMEQGNPTANDLAWALSFLSQKSGNDQYQQMGNILAFTRFNDITKELVVFDTEYEFSGNLTRSTRDYINGITENSWVFGNGSAPYYPKTFVESDGDVVTYWTRDFSSKGYISIDKGQTIIPIESDFNEYGGASAVIGMKGNTAVGYASYKFNVNTIDDILDDTGGCSDPEVLKNLPFEVCVQRYRDNLYHMMAYKWTFDQQGNITEATPLGLLVTPNPEDDRVYDSVAQAINIHGVAVGYTWDWDDKDPVTVPDNNERRRLYPVMYKDGEVINLIQAKDDFWDGRTFDINDNGFAVGHAYTRVNGTIRNKFFYVDTNMPANEVDIIQPDGFFNSSSSTARGINNNNLVVGYGQVETHNESGGARRTHGFLYDINASTFTDINALITCNNDYTVYEATGINDLNEITAAAVVSVHKKDAKGELMYDVNGEPIVTDVVRAVVLKPIDGEIEDCTKVEEKVERQGAGFGFGLLGLLAIFGFCRRFKN